MNSRARTGAGRSGSAGNDGLLRPQRLLHEAARDARLAAAPSGLGLDSAAVRRRMIERLRRDGIADEAVLAAIERVPRDRFVDSAFASQAYEEAALPIGLGQTISSPGIVARMLEYLAAGSRAKKLGHLGHVLEIGTGCGYQTAVLIHLCSHLVSIERLLGLLTGASERLTALGLAGDLPRPVLIHGDGRLGDPARAPFDSMIAAACGDEVPPAWIDQLAVGGRLVAPVAETGSGRQALLIVDREPSGIRKCWGEAVRFVPLKFGAV